MNDQESKMRLYMHTLTKHERGEYIKGMNETLKKLADDFKISSSSSKDTSNISRDNLNRFGLFGKSNYFRYFMSKRIVNALLTTSADTIIYGGYIRDNLIHDHMATLFYNKYAIFEDYNNPTIDENSMFRTLVPQDIDVIFQRKRDYDLFVLSLESLNFKIDQFLPREPYLGEDASQTRFKAKVYSDFPLQFMKNRPRLLSPAFFDSYVWLDITIDILSSTVATKDFKCNSLKMNTNGFVADPLAPSLFYNCMNDRIMGQKSTFDAAMEIKSQILKMEAHCFYVNGQLNIPAYYRIEKMFKKGYRIVIETDDKDDDYRMEQIIDGCDDCCIICRDDIREIANVPGVHRLYNGVRFNCCSAVYHPKCMEKIFQNRLIDIEVSYISSDYKCIQCGQISFEDIILSEWISFLGSLDTCWNANGIERQL